MGKPGKLKVTGFLSHGRAGDFQDAINLSQPGQPFAGDPNNALASVRIYRNRTGVSLNLEQQVNDSVGVFARAGWADGAIEPWDFTDIDRTIQAGVSIAGKQWGRPDDTIGVARVVNGIAPVHQAYFNAGGLEFLGRRSTAEPRLRRPHRGLLQLRVDAVAEISADYQFIINPAYNIQRGPANVFAGRIHGAF